jgi:ATP-dependent DNA helicase RecG
VASWQIDENMSITLNDLQHWMALPSESEHLEFKEAATHFDFEKLLRYCCALANEGGGRLVLGVTNKPPRQVIGTRAFPSLEPVKSDLYQRLRFRVRAEELSHPKGRVVVFEVPPRPIGQPVRVDRIYWMRAGDSLTEMSEDRLKEIFNEAQSDFSRELCPQGTAKDLDRNAVKDFRKRWVLKSKNHALSNLSEIQLLNDAELMRGDQVTYAALVLFGTREALGKFLPNVELIFEYRSTDASIPSQQRENFRQGLFLMYDQIWELVNRRNDLQHYQEGLFIYDIPTFDEEVVREAFLNAICHRDYRLQGSVFIRQSPNHIQFTSPGGFPDGITPENCLYKQSPRNRTIAEALEKCGLVERSGQGFDKIFSKCLRESKPLPDFTGTDAYQVNLKLSGVVQDPAFVRFLEKLGASVHESFYVDDLLLLDCLRQGKKIPNNLIPRLDPLIDAGAVELISRGRGARYILSKKFYDFSGRKGAYTRKRGLDRETNKELIIRHLKHHQRGTILEFEEVLPTLTRYQIHSLLKDLRSEGRILHVGPKKGGFWERPQK